MNFLVAIAARTGQMLDYANLSNQIGVCAPTIKNWVSILERTGIIYLLDRVSRRKGFVTKRFCRERF